MKQHTRIQWCILYLNAYFPCDYFFEKGFSINFIWLPPDDPETITIDCTYVPDADRALLNESVEKMKEAVKAFAEAYGWDWIKIKERVTMLKLK